MASQIKIYQSWNDNNNATTQGRKQEKIGRIPIFVIFYIGTWCFKRKTSRVLWHDTKHVVAGHSTYNIHNLCENFIWHTVEEVSKIKGRVANWILSPSLIIKRFFFCLFFDKNFASSWLPVVLFQLTCFSRGRDAFNLA